MKTPLSQWSLRNRLVLGIALLSSLGFIASGVVAQKSLENFLVHQIDDQLVSVATGALPRVSEAGIVNDEQRNRARSFSSDSDDDDERPATPLTSVPTATSLTLLNAEGNVIGGLGGGLNRVSASDYLEGISLAKTAEFAGKPFTLKSAEENFRVLALPLPANLGSVAIAQSLEDVERTLHRLQWLLLLIGGIVISFIAIASRLVIKVSLKPLSRVEETAEKIAAGDLSARLPDAKPLPKWGA
jgi:two-component system, OmpR family, sensor kinase